MANRAMAPNGLEPVQWIPWRSAACGQRRWAVCSRIHHFLGHQPSFAPPI